MNGYSGGRAAGCARQSRAEPSRQSPLSQSLRPQSLRPSLQRRPSGEGSTARREEQAQEGCAEGRGGRAGGGGGRAGGR
jgi:hypothetical protein